MAKLIKSTCTGIAAASLLSASTMAIAAPAPNAAKALSVPPQRAVTPAADAQQFAGIPGTSLINVGILAALVAIVLVATTTGGNNDNNGTPASR